MQVKMRWAAAAAALAVLGGCASAPADGDGQQAGQARGCPSYEVVAGGTAAPLSYVRYLADDALEGRLAGTAAERCAGDFIAARLKALGATPAGENGTWFQTLPLASVANPHAPQGSGRNVVALIEGSDPVLRQELVVLGAHYDHLGRGEFGSTAPARAGEVHNGADDNASGVAALLHAAELLAAGPRPARSILLVAFTGEESGLLGSAYFTKHPTVELDRAVGMINMDMVGRLAGGGLVVNGFDTATEWRELLERYGNARRIPMQFVGGGYGASDHTSFYIARIPVLHFFTNTHGEYHNPGDDWQLIDAAGLEAIGGLAADVARDVANRRAQLTLVDTPPPAPRGGSGSGAWLGTVPDFSPVERGVLLGGVSAGSPAEKAGMRKGDILIGLGGEEVASLEAMTAVLARHRPGDRVEIVVLRDGREQKLEAVLGSRSSR